MMMMGALIHVVALSGFCVLAGPYAALYFNGLNVEEVVWSSIHAAFLLMPKLLQWMYLSQRGRKTILLDVLSWWIVAFWVISGLFWFSLVVT